MKKLILLLCMRHILFKVILIQYWAQKPKHSDWITFCRKNLQCVNKILLHKFTYKTSSLGVTILYVGSICLRNTHATTQFMSPGEPATWSTVLKLIVPQQVKQ